MILQCPDCYSPRFDGLTMRYGIPLRRQGLPSLTHSQSLLMSLVTTDGIRISELARRLDMTRQGAQKSVVGLEAVELVQMTVDPRNSSAKIVRLTETGVQNIAIAQKIFIELEQELASRIGEENVSTLRKTLARDWSNPPVISQVGF